MLLFKIVDVVALLGMVAMVLGIVTVIVDAFKVSATWGSICCSVPFGIFVFVLKFWFQRRWLRFGTFCAAGGLVTLLILIIILENMI